MQNRMSVCSLETIFIGHILCFHYRKDELQLLPSVLITKINEVFGAWHKGLQAWEKYGYGQPLYFYLSYFFLRLFLCNSRLLPLSPFLVWLPYAKLRQHTTAQCLTWSTRIIIINAFQKHEEQHLS